MRLNFRELLKLWRWRNVLNGKMGRNSSFFHLIIRKGLTEYKLLLTRMGLSISTLIRAISNKIGSAVSITSIRRGFLYRAAYLIKSHRLYYLLFLSRMIYLCLSLVIYDALSIIHDYSTNAY